MARNGNAGLKSFVIDCSIHLSNTRPQASIPLRSAKGIERMLSFGMWSHMALDRTDISEEHAASIFRVEGINELETMLAITSN
jgi:hypothetical protein